MRKAPAQMPFLSLRRRERIDIRWPRSNTGIHPVDLKSHIPNRPWSEYVTQTFAQVVLSVWAFGLDVDIEHPLYMAQRDIAEAGVVCHLRFRRGCHAVYDNRLEDVERVQWW
jgi:hypothetical protein